jgi:hypothetical protein
MIAKIAKPNVFIFLSAPQSPASTAESGELAQLAEKK